LKEEEEEEEEDLGMVVRGLFYSLNGDFVSSSRDRRAFVLVLCS